MMKYILYLHSILKIKFILPAFLCLASVFWIAKFVPENGKKNNRLDPYKKIKGECFLVMAGKDLTTDGSVIVAHCEDCWDGYSTRLARVPRQTHSETEVEVNYETIPQVPVTYAYWGMGVSTAVAEKYKEGDWILNGMNEYGVVVSCNMMIGCREEEIPKGKGLTRYAIRKLLLERSKTAEEAMVLVGQLIDKYTICGSPVAFCLADSNEIWLVETTSRRWVAKKIASDSSYVEPNCYTIGESYDYASDDLVEYAQEQGWYDPSEGDFSFKYAYSDPLFLILSYNTSRVYQGETMLLEKIDEINIDTIKDIVTKPPIMDDMNQSTAIWHLRGDMPVGVGCMMWFGYAGGDFTGMAPVYAASQESPDSYSDSSLEYDENYAFWQSYLLKLNLYPGTWVYSQDYLPVKVKVNKFQKKIFKKTEKVEAKILALYNKGNDEKAEELLSKHTVKELNRVFKQTSSIVKKYGFVWGE